jgi:hypothetical protein
MRDSSNHPERRSVYSLVSESDGYRERSCRLCTTSIIGTQIPSSAIIIIIIIRAINQLPGHSFILVSRVNDNVIFAACTE